MEAYLNNFAVKVLSIVAVLHEQDELVLRLSVLMKLDYTIVLHLRVNYTLFVCKVMPESVLKFILHNLLLYRLLKDTQKL